MDNRAEHRPEQPMTAFPEYSRHDGLRLAKLVRAKQVAPAELVEEAITRIEAHNPKINAVVYSMYDQARAAAKPASRAAGPARAPAFPHVPIRPS